MLIRNNKAAPAGLFLRSMAAGDQTFAIAGGITIALPDELDDEIREHSGNRDLFKAGDLEEITRAHVRVTMPRNDRRRRVRLAVPIEDEAWQRDPFKPSERAITIRSGHSELVHPDFLAKPGIRSLIETGTLEVQS